ncbi:MAG TPA: SDR family NAD(P)-dependent oxidoreductase [Acidisarcina sp.]|nr:SDR family NAD(P)-dependent oxidoreductase [Acidisarcina sp.]
MNGRFSGRVVLVAGGTGGLGHSVSLALLKEEATVVVTYRHPEELVDLQTSAGALTSSLVAHQVDVTDEAAAAKLIESILAAQGRFDAMVNTVGAYAGGVPLWELNTRVFDQMLSLNLRAGYSLSRAAIPPMLRQKRGAIVNVVAKAALDHAAGASAYAASKAAALAMMDCLAADVKGTGVRVNSILPSIIDTKANRIAIPKADYSTWPKPEEIARVILFLLSDDAKVVHGAAIPVYGDS